MKRTSANCVAAESCFSSLRAHESISWFYPTLSSKQPCRYKDASQQLAWNSGFSGQSLVTPSRCYIHSYRSGHIACAVLFHLPTIMIFLDVNKSRFWFYVLDVFTENIQHWLKYILFIQSFKKLQLPYPNYCNSQTAVTLWQHYDLHFTDVGLRLKEW